MTRLNRIALALASAALLGGTAAAQDRVNPARPSTDITRNLGPGDKRATTLIGATVKNSAGDDIGEVEDLIVAGKSNVAAAVISVGGVLGVGAKRIGVAFNDFEVSPDGRTLYISLTEQQLEAAPEFDYDVEAVAARPAGSPAHNTVAADTAKREVQIARADPAPRAVAAPSEPAERTLKSGEQNAKALIGADVVDSGDDKVGKIRDLIVAPNGVQAVLMVGGAGIVNGHLVVVPLNSLKIQPAAESGDEPERVQTSMTASQLGALPEFHYN